MSMDDIHRALIGISCYLEERRSNKASDPAEADNDRRLRDCYESRYLVWPQSSLHGKFGGGTETGGSPSCMHCQPAASLLRGV